MVARVNKGLPETEKIKLGQEEAGWTRIGELYQTAIWKAECLGRDEKFDMHYSASVSISLVNT